MEADLDTQLSQLARRLSSQATPLADAVMERMRETLPEWMRDPTLFETSRQFARESIELELQWLQAGSLPEACPAVDAGAARQGAHAGVPLDILLLGYRAGHAAQWRAWFRLVEADAPDNDLRRVLIERGSQFFFEYADRLSQFVTQEFTHERDRMLRSREHRRMSLIRELLEGGEVNAEDLGYDPSGHHIGVAAIGPGVESGLSELARSIDRTLLTLLVDDDVVLAWLGGRKSVEPGWEHAAERVARRRGLFLSFGDPAKGVDGFRRTHRQATRAQKFPSRDRPGEIVHHEQVALEALAAVDEEEAAAFIARELRGLDGEGTRDRRLRETLSVWFVTGQTRRLPLHASGFTSRRWPRACVLSRHGPADQSLPGVPSLRPPCGCGTTSAESAGVGSRSCPAAPHAWLSATGAKNRRVRSRAP